MQRIKRKIIDCSARNSLLVISKFTVLEKIIDSCDETSLNILRLMVATMEKNFETFVQDVRITKY